MIPPAECEACKKPTIADGPRVITTGEYAAAIQDHHALLAAKDAAFEAYKAEEARRAEGARQEIGRLRAFIQMVADCKPQLGFNPYWWIDEARRALDGPSRADAAESGRGGT